jgi:hydroxyacyl-ACP dehydratase HTD2-like protein with hotdog domain
MPSPWRGARFHAPLRIADELTRETEIADIAVDENESGSRVVIVERNSISNARGLAGVEERDLIFRGKDRAKITEIISTSPPLSNKKWLQIRAVRAGL